METALIILLWVAIIVAVYQPLKDLATKCVATIRNTNLKKRSIWYGVLAGALLVVLYNPAVFPTLFWKTFSLTLIGLGFVAYPIVTIIFTWQNRNNPEVLKQLHDKVNNSIANAEKYGQH